MEQIRVIRMVHDQQREMLDRKSRRIEHRIISLHHPHVRPIVRGKAGRETEFGAKLTASLENGYTRIERLFWEAYNEASDLQTICERYKTQWSLSRSDLDQQILSQPGKTVVFC